MNQETWRSFWVFHVGFSAVVVGLNLWLVAALHGLVPDPPVSRAVIWLMTFWEFGVVVTGALLEDIAKRRPH